MSKTSYKIFIQCNMMINYALFTHKTYMYMYIRLILYSVINIILFFIRLNVFIVMKE